jgi:hypothetical protein
MMQVTTLINKLILHLKHNLTLLHQRQRERKEVDGKSQKIRALRGKPLQIKITQIILYQTAKRVIQMTTWSEIEMLHLSWHQTRIRMEHLDIKLINLIDSNPK